MNTNQWDADIEKGIVGDELKRHMYNLWSLSGGKVGKKPPMGSVPSFFLFLIVRKI